MSGRLSLAKQVSDVWTNLSQVAEGGDLERLIAAAERIAEALEQIAADSDKDENLHEENAPRLAPAPASLVENPATQTLGGRLLIDRVRMRREQTDENLACAVRICRTWMDAELAVGFPLPSPPIWPRDVQHRIELGELTLSWHERSGWILVAVPPQAPIRDHYDRYGYRRLDPTIWTAPVDQSNGSDPDERPAEGDAPSNERAIPF